MQIKLSLLFMPFFFLTGCINDSAITLQGKIDQFNAKITFTNKGSKYTGILEYLDIEKTPIELSGVLEQDILTFHEFDDNNNLAGTFKGILDSESYKGHWIPPDKKRKFPFSFQLIQEQDNNPNITDNKEKPISIVPKDLIQKLFTPKEFKNKTSAYYHSVDNGNYLVEYGAIKYIYDKTQALIFFYNYPVDENNVRETYHVSVGFVSIARIKRKKDKWYLTSFSQECCGSSSWGGTTTPTIEKVGSKYFLYTHSGYVGQGHFTGGHHYYEINTFKNVLSSSEEDNHAATIIPKEQFSYTSQIELFEEKDQIKAKVTYTGTNYISKAEGVLDISREEIYSYNENIPMFIKEN